MAPDDFLRGFGLAEIASKTLDRPACLTLAVMHEGQRITTIEGLAQGDKLSPMQQAFLEHDAATGA